MNYKALGDMERSQLYTAADNMQKYGGHFATAIAKAFCAADSDNRQLLLQAFGHLFEQYAPARWNNG